MSRNKGFSEVLRGSLSLITASMMLVSILGPLAAYAVVGPSVTIDSINGQPYTGHCIAGPLVIVVHGVTGSNGGPYSLVAGNGFSTSSPGVSAASGSNASFSNKTINYTPTGASNNLYVNLFHGSQSGQDSHLIVINQCVAAPTQGAVTIKKHVIDDNSGNLTAPNFTLHISTSTFSGAEAGTDFLLSAGNYTVSEDVVSGYTQTSLVCAGNNATTTNGTFTVVAGKNYVCTVTNDDDAVLPPPPPVDVCLNVTGVQETGPCSDQLCTDGGGIWNSETQSCDATPPVDVCVNVTSVQTSGPCADNVCSEQDGGLWNTETQTCVIPPTDICPNVTGVQTEGTCADQTCTDQGGTWNAETQTCTPAPVTCDAGFHVVDNACVPDEQTPPPPSNNTPSNPPSDISTTPSGHRHDTGPGQVLGASTVGQVLGESCGLYMDKFIRVGKKNDIDQVTKLQEFLNKHMQAGLPVTGVYGPLSLDAVNKFQTKYAAEILIPWNLNAPTGIVYQTTLRWINMIECPDLALQIPELVPWSSNPELPHDPIVANTESNSNKPINAEDQSASVVVVSGGTTSTSTASTTPGFWGSLLKKLFGK